MKLRWLALKLALGSAIAAMALAASCGGSSNNPDDGGANPSYTRQSVVEACVRMHSCGVFRLTHVHNCIRNYESREVVPYGKAALYKHLHQCVNKAKGDCAAVRDCFGNKPADAECNSSYAAGCDGEVRRFCDLLDKRVYRIDCAKGGLKCGEDSKGQPFCGAGSCKSSTQNECVDNDTRRVYCVGQGLQIEQCDWIDLKCGLDRDKNIGCVAKGKKCKG